MVSFSNVVSGVLLIVVAIFAAKEFKPDLFSIFSRTPEKIDYFPLITDMPAPVCYHVALVEILQLQQSKEWARTIQSMVYHMETKELDAISAFHVGSGNCFMIIKQEDGTLLHMFNPVFRGYSVNLFDRVSEVSVACPQSPRVIQRAKRVVVTYNEAVSGHQIVERFEDQQALDVQAMTMYLLGKTICTMHKTNSDEGLDTLKKMIVSI